MKTPPALDKFCFRGLHPHILIGTASDRYAGWLGQIYTREKYASRLTRRTNRVGGKAFVEEVLPVDSVAEYFDHFQVLEIDYTFYRPLLEHGGEPTQSYHVLRSYRRYVKEGDRLFLKVPQVVFSQKLRRQGRYVENETYLDAELFTRQFYEPAVKLLGPTLHGLIFEQEYQRKQERLPVEVMAKALDGFFDAVPRDDRYHVEFRTETYLCEPVFAVLRDYGIGQVLSHWTWLPPLRKQFAMSGRRFLNAKGRAVVRLMTPIGMRYEEAYAKAHPFDKIVEGMLQSRMVGETVDLMKTGVDQEVQMSIIINNRAGGNAPIIARKIAASFLGMNS